MIINFQKSTTRINNKVPENELFCTIYSHRLSTVKLYSERSTNGTTCLLASPWTMTVIVVAKNFYLFLQKSHYNFGNLFQAWQIVKSWLARKKGQTIAHRCITFPFQAPTDQPCQTNQRQHRQANKTGCSTFCELLHGRAVGTQDVEAGHGRHTQLLVHPRVSQPSVRAKIGSRE